MSVTCACVCVPVHVSDKEDADVTAKRSGVGQEVVTVNTKGGNAAAIGAYCLVGGARWMPRRRTSGAAAAASSIKAEAACVHFTDTTSDSERRGCTTTSRSHPIDCHFYPSIHPSI